MKILLLLLTLSVSTNAIAIWPDKDSDGRYPLAQQSDYPARAMGKCYKNVRIEGERMTGDWVCEKPRAATAEESKSLTEK